MLILSKVIEVIEVLCFVYVHSFYKSDKPASSTFQWRRVFVKNMSRPIIFLNVKCSKNHNWHSRVFFRLLYSIDRDTIVQLMLTSKVADTLFISKGATY